MAKPPHRPAPTALACGLLQDGERILFLKQKGADGIERISLPFCMLFAGQDPVRKMAEFFLEQTGIDGHVQDVRWQARHNVGSRKNKRFVPVLGFRVDAKNRHARPGSGFSGVIWLTLEAACGQKLDRTCEWLRQVRG